MVEEALCCSLSKQFYLLCPSVEEFLYNVNVKKMVEKIQNNKWIRWMHSIVYKKLYGKNKSQTKQQQKVGHLASGLLCCADPLHGNIYNVDKIRQSVMSQKWLCSPMRNKKGKQNMERVHQLLQEYGGVVSFIFKLNDFANQYYATSITVLSQRRAYTQ